MISREDDQARRRLFIRPAARRDLARTFRWYERRVEGLGNEFLRAASVTLSAIQRAPEQYPVVFEDVQRAVMRRFPYVVDFAALSDDVIAVIAVMHGRQHPQRWQLRR